VHLWWQVHPLWPCPQWTVSQGARHRYARERHGAHQAATPSPLHFTSHGILTCYYVPCIVHLLPVALQIEVTRSLREGLRTSSGSGSGLLAPVTLSPALSFQGLPSVVDAVKTVWPRNPFDPLPPGEGGVGGVLEYTLRDGTTRTVVDLPQVTSSSADLPMHFLVAIGTQ
jgi:hypothetical protein